MKALLSAFSAVPFLCHGVFSLGFAQQLPSLESPRRFNLHLEIGKAIGPPEYTFGAIIDIAPSGSGDIYVLDVQSSRVKQYNSAGDFVRAFGQRGSGPGEFIRPTYLVISQDSLHVYDSGTWRISTFTFDGEITATRPLPSIPGQPVSITLPLRGQLYFGKTTARFSRGGPSHRHKPNYVLFVTDSLGTQIDTLISYHSGGTIWYIPGQNVPWGSVPMSGAPFGPGGAWAVSGDSIIAVVDGYESAIHWYQVRAKEYKLMGTSRLPVGPRPITEEDIENAKAVVRENSSLDLPREIALETPPAWSAATEALFSHGGKLWVHVRDSKEEWSTWVVYKDVEAAPRWVQLPADFHLKAVRNGKLYGVAITDMDVQKVRVYENGIL